MQQDRGLIFSPTAQTVEVSNYLLYGIVPLQIKEKETRSREGKVQSVTFSNIYIYCFKCTHLSVVF